MSEQGRVKEMMTANRRPNSLESGLGPDAKYGAFEAGNLEKHVLNGAAHGKTGSGRKNSRQG